MDHVTMSETGRMDSVSSELVEPKTEPEIRPESPMIRVCDTPSSTRSMHSPSGEVIIIIIIIIIFWHFFLSISWSGVIMMVVYEEVDSETDMVAD